jgi:hypothetical protein
LGGGGGGGGGGDEFVNDEVMKSFLWINCCCRHIASTYFCDWGFSVVFFFTLGQVFLKTGAVVMRFYYFYMKYHKKYDRVEAERSYN